MLETTRGIVLHSIKYSENSLIVDIFTESRGNVSFLVKIPRSKKHPVNSVLLRPLNILELVFDFRVNQNLQRISEMRVAVPYMTIPYNPLKETLALFLSEFLFYALRNESENAALYLYLQNSLEWLDSRDERFANFHLVFLLRLTLFLGIWPNVEEYRWGNLFDLQGGYFCEVQPPHGSYLEPDEARLLPVLVRMNYHTMHLFRMSRNDRARFLEVLNEYYSIHIPNFPALKSISVLREVLS